MTQQDGRHDDLGEKIREEVSKASSSVKVEAGKVGAHARDVAKDEANVQFQKGKVIADEQLDTLSSAIDDAASRLDEEGHPLASYASELATQLGRLSSTIESSSLDDVARSTHRLARENPGLFMLGSVALGFTAARFIKASDERDRRSSHGSEPRASNPDYRIPARSAGNFGTPGSVGAEGVGTAPVDNVSTSTVDGSTYARYGKGDGV